MRLLGKVTDPYGLPRFWKNTHVMPRRLFLYVISIFLSWNYCLVGQDDSVESRIAVAGVKPEEVRTFLRKLQAGVAGNDSNAICSMAAFPLITRVPGRVRNADICRRNYSRIFNLRVINAIKGQKFDSLFANYKGVMVGSGEVWIAGVCIDKGCTDYDLRIITVNN